MDRTLALPASPAASTSLAALARLDPKRIAGTSVAIAVHVVVLMLLLMPVTTAPAPAVDDPSVVVVPDVVIRKLAKVPPPPTARHVLRHETARAALPRHDPPPQPVDDTPSPGDPYVPPRPEGRADSFDATAVESVFAQITADIAPVPPYPPQGLARRLAGEVLLRIRVDSSGRPLDVTIERSSGSSLLDEAARKFVKARWHFVPAMQDGHAVEAFALLPINYSLPR
jgi:protein TonB